VAQRAGVTLQVVPQGIQYLVA